MLRQVLPALLASLLTGVAGAAEKIVLYGDDDYAPYSYVEDGRFKGIYVELLRQAAVLLAPDYELELKPTPWKRGLRDLELGSTLGLFPPYFRPNARPYIQPYSAPLYHEVVVLFCTEKVMKVPRKRFPEDFGGLTIGVNLGFIISEPMLVAAKQGKLAIEEAKGNNANIMKLASKRIDCYANDRLSVLYSAKRLRAAANAPDSIKALILHEAAVLSGEDAFIGYSELFQAGYKQDFIQRMNGVLETLRKNGAINPLLAQAAM
ncbi:amino acid ABC transporter substrate-binding protein [Chitinimonas arctica]|uniref:Amino acid ABC transporter substrate-binding protein n=1 Tax=Chitinimonas arctica TaxID=2594795 RepID=A0A516SL64_9NEIS|nr:transporter substrate-binding domain-containing protein [Chitinimonas arctica]QDQ28758.1 amino acid ABC transporter substrate-binding protein [Chitinimonas arctica]